MPTNFRIAAVGKRKGVLVALLLVSFLIWQFASTRARADGTALLVPPVQGCIDATAYGLGLYSDGSGTITVNSPAPVAGAFIEWVGAQDKTPDDPRASVLLINDVEVVGQYVNETVSYNATRDWYSWYADIGPNGAGIIQNAGDTEIRISGWDNPNPRTNGATITIVYETGECEVPNTIQVLTGIDWFYHGTPDEPFSELMLYEYLSADVDRVATIFLSHAGLDVTASTCRGSAVWMLAGNGTPPGKQADILGRTSSGQGYGINNGVEIVNDPFTTASIPCDPVINSVPDAPYQQGHLYPNGANESPYRALAIRPDVGGNVGREWALLAVDVVIPANTNWVAFQLESEKDQFGHSGAWAGGGTIVLRETAVTKYMPPSSTTLPTEPTVPEVEKQSKLKLETSLSMQPALGESLQFQYAVKNEGETQLASVSVSTMLCGDVVYQSGDSDGNKMLDPQEEWLLDCTYVVLGNALERVTASAMTPSGDLITAVNEIPIDVIEPAGLKLDVSADSSSNVIGTDVTYNYDISNIGTQPLYNPQLTDDVCEPRVYQYGDSNGDGALDIDETWRLNCTLALWANTTVSQIGVTAQTADNLTVQTSGQITVELEDPPANTNTTTLPVEQPDLTFVQSIEQPINLSRIGGTVWIDDNQDGVRSVSEPVLSNVVVQIFKDENGNGYWNDGDTYVDKYVTNEEGGYVFEVPEGNYLVYVLVDASPLAGLEQNSGSNVIYVASGEGRFDLDFGFKRLSETAVLPDPPEATIDETQPGRISSEVWFDANGNGLRDAGELKVQSVIVNLFNSSGVLQAISVTDGNGRFTFEQLAPDNYSMQFILPSRFAYTIQDAGNDDLRDSDVDAFGMTPEFYVGNGQSVENVTAGVLLK